MNSSALAEQLQLLPEYLSGHMLLTILALAGGMIICLPLGLMVTRLKPLQFPVLTAASILQTIPGLALLALMVPLLGTIGFLPALLALVLYSFLPILRNSVTGVLGVDPGVVESARGLGMTDLQVLRQVELPLALPVIVAGIRTAAVWVVGTATLATPVGATSLGNFVFSGLQTQNLTAIVVGCVAAALLAILLDLLIRLAELALVRRSRRLGIISVAALIILVGGALAPMLNRVQANESSLPVVVIGSKPFTEQYILAQLIDDRLTEAGFETDLRPGMGSIVLYQALATGAVDCYVDYSGTIWTNVMKKISPASRERMIDEISGWLKEEDSILCLGSLGFENTYALAVSRSLAERYDLSSIEELAARSADLVMGSDYEFFARPEWAALTDKYSLKLKEKISMDPALMYSAIEQKKVDIISAYSTDGRLVAYDLKVLSDTKGALPPYDAIILLSARAAKEPELVAQLKRLSLSISDDLMRQANKIVDVDHKSVRVATDFLAEQIRQPD